MDENHQDWATHKLVTTDDKIWLPPSYTNNKPPPVSTVPKKKGINWGGADKSFWEWLLLLGTLLAALGAIAIPFVVAIIGFNFTQQQAKLSVAASERQHQTDLQIARDQQQANILQTYIDNIQDLLLNHNLLKSKSGDDVATLARARTLTALRGLDPQRKGILLNFLYEAILIGYYDLNTNELLNSIIDLASANLTGAELSSAPLAGANLTRANLSGADLDGADLTSANLDGANLIGADLTSAILTRAILTDAHLNKAHLNKAHFAGADMTYANLDNADLYKATLTDADLYKADLGYADLTAAVLYKADLGYADLTGAHLDGADLTGVHLDGAVLLDAYLFDADLTGADLDHAFLAYAHLGNAILTRANLTSTDLSGADLSDATVTQQQLDQVYSCKDAILPKGLTCHHNQ